MAIIGQMGELGDDSLAEHERVVEQLREADFGEVWLVGSEFKPWASEFKWFASADDVKAELASKSVSNRYILIKGSNSVRLYQLPELL